MHADTPPESIHMMDAAQLARPGIWFYVMREVGAPIGMGALKAITDQHAEIKSMHILAEGRGRGLARRMLDHLLSEAQARGFSRLSLETGSQASFTPARQLYLAAGFEICPAFEGYHEDPMSTFMTKALI
jgi:putative acetyltransferase